MTFNTNIKDGLSGSIRLDINLKFTYICAQIWNIIKILEQYTNYGYEILNIYCKTNCDCIRCQEISKHDRIFCKVFVVMKFDNNLIPINFTILKLNI